MQTGRKILNLRCDRKISQQDLARACNITPSALSKIEAGINSPRANVIWRIAKNLGVTVEYLLDENMPYPYAGYNFRQEFLVTNVDPSSTVRMDCTREEKAFLEALRKTNQIARDAAMAIPEASVEHLRLVHFILNHARILNPSQNFLRSFESLFDAQSTGDNTSGTDGEGDGEGMPRKAGARGRKRARARAGK